MSEWNDMDEAPRDGTPIEGQMPDGEIVEIRYVETRRCMLAGIGGGNGYFGPGWEDTENALIADNPIAWRYPEPLEEQK